MAVGDTVKKDIFWLARELGISFACDAIFKAFVDHVKTKGPQIATTWAEKKLLNDKRAELLEEFRLLEWYGLGDEPADPTQITGKKKVNISNLRRRHEESKRQFRENRFVDLLLKICKDEKLGRRKTLLWLNKMDDQQFDQALYMLEHDVLIQWIKWAIHTWGELTEGSYAELGKFILACAKITKDFAVTACATTGKAAKKAYATADLFAANSVAPRLAALNDFIEENGGRR